MFRCCRRARPKAIDADSALTTTARTATEMIIVTQAPVRRMSYSDNFNRANSATSVGTDWTNRLGTCGISSNTFYIAASTGFATYNNVMGTDNHSVSAKVTAVGSGAGGIIAISAGSSGTVAYLWVTATNSWLYLATGLTLSSPHVEAFSAGGSAVGDVWTVSVSGTVYTVKQNSTVKMNVDTASTFTHDSAHRMVGLGGTIFGGSWGWDDFAAWDS